MCYHLVCAHLYATLYVLLVRAKFNDNETREDMSRIANLLMSLLPVLFVLQYKVEGSLLRSGMTAAAVLVLIVCIQLVSRKLNCMAMGLSFVIGVFYGLTLYNKSSYIVKLKPTIIHTICAVACLISLMIKKPIVSILLRKYTPELTRISHNSTLVWMFFFVSCALINELIRSYYSDEIWFFSKICLIPMMTAGMLAIQVGFLLKLRFAKQTVLIK